MRINATVEYGVQRRRIVVPCGDGRKSVKWLKKDSERVIEDTIMASFKGCGAYRRFVEEVFPVVPVTPTGRDSY